MDSVTEHLSALYGPERGAAAALRVRESAEHHLGAAPRENARPLSERDALLITYGDQIRGAGEPPLASLAAFLEQRLQGVVNGVHILPFYPSTSDDGFSVTDYYAVDPGLGRWEDVRRIGQSFEMMFDAVFNHMSARSGWFLRFLDADEFYREFFVSVEGEPSLAQVVRPRALPLLTGFAAGAGKRNVWTTFSADQVDLNAKDPAVIAALLDVLFFYVSQGARWIRLDAIAYLWKEIGTCCIHLPQTHRIVQLFRAALDQWAPGVRLITETNVPHTDNISYFGDGTNEAHLVYNFALPPLVLHAIHRGNSEYLHRWAGSLTTPSPEAAFFNFLASHDGIGVNPARGILPDAEVDALVRIAVNHGGYVSYKHNPDGTKSPYELNINYFDALSDPGADEPDAVRIDRFMAAQAIMLSLRGVPGIYFHSLLGSRNDRAGAEQSGIPRRINRQKLSRTALEDELDRPDSVRARVFARYRELLSVRKSEPAFSPRGSQRVIDAGPRLFVLERADPLGQSRVLCAHNVSGERATLSVAGLGRVVRPLIGSAAGTEIELEPYQAVWARLE